MPNISETVVVFLAAASLGAPFVSCAPEFGVASVVDRLAQVAPKVLFVVDGYRFGSKSVDRLEEVAAVRAALPTVQATVVLPYLDAERAASIPGAFAWSWVMEAEPDTDFAELTFDHPLYILFSSGSTGPPKPIVHGHGGITLEHLKWLVLHTNITPRDVVFWPSTTGWMTWNVGVSTLLCGARSILFDGDPTQPDLAAFWQLVARTKTTHLGVSPPLLRAARQAGLVPANVGDLSRLRVLSSGGSPLSEDLFHWVYESVGSELMLASVSGGTDCCTAFVGGSPLVPVTAGEIACRFLGTKVEAFDQNGRSVIGEQAELVLTEPIPSMPVEFWGDHDGSRLRSAYFGRFTGVWCHGDWITITDRGTAVITGRSDATLNRGGVRMGTQEFYSAVEEIPTISDSLIIHLENSEGGLGELLMFISLTSDGVFDESLKDQIRQTLRERLSPRYVPDEIIEVPVIPRTITGKRLEVPVKRILSGVAVGPEVRASLTDGDALDRFVALAASRSSSPES
jgi:acetoacetyl-CoA synthetase